MEQTNINKNTRAKKLLVFTSVLFLVGISFLSGYSFRDKNISDYINGNGKQPKEVDLSLFWEAWNVLDNKSVKNTDSKQKTDGAIAGMLASLDDPYTTYFSKEENKRFREDIQGEFFGIGIEIIQKEGYPTVVAPLPDTPAEKSGLKAGDIILQVDEFETSEIGYDETINKIRGAEGSKVVLKIVRQGEDSPMTFEVVRSRITVKSVEWSEKTLEGKKYQIIKLRQFGDDTENLFSQAVNDAIAKKPDGIVVDLRNNPGGYLETAVNLSSYFIKDGIIVSEKGKENNNKDYASTGNGKLDGFKVVILTNNGSASASEILAGALQDRRGIKVVGEKTFGKGSVQELIDLSDGSALKITVANWFTPNGRQINKEGIKPDIEISDDEATDVDEQENRAFQYLLTGQ